MPFIIGLLLIPVAAAIMYKANLVTTKKKSRILLNLLLVVIPLAFIIFCWIVRMEPFDFEDHYSLEYMIFTGEYVLYSGVIFLFSPFMWMIVIYFFSKLFRSVRVRKNAVIKRDDEFLYYRGDLDKLSPAIIMFASKLQLDVRKSISATILKLKLSGYIEEVNGGYRFTNKEESGLLESEKMVLNLIRHHYFDKKRYQEVVEKETVKNRYLTKNRGGIPLRIVKMIIAVSIPFFAFAFAFWLDEYTHENYHVYPEKDGHAYICLTNDKEIENLYYNEVKDLDHYYHGVMYDGSLDYNYAKIRADKLQYSPVRKAFFLNSLGTLTVGFFAVFICMAGYLFVEQIVYFTKNYTRTIKGKKLLNKAYALKNYLKQYSMIKNRTEAELVLWEYYLVYAVALEVNVKIEDAMIERYLAGIEGI